TPPYRNSGLYALPGESATARQAACAKRLALPTTNVAKVKLGLRRESVGSESVSPDTASAASKSGSGAGASGGGAALGSTVITTSQSRPRTPDRVSRIRGT